MRVHVQKFGTFLSNMVMPNIGAFIAWGLITALFIPDGGRPTRRSPRWSARGSIYLLPILIAYTGGKIVYASAAASSAVSVIGVIMATSDPLIIGTDGADPDVPGRDDHGSAHRLVLKRSTRSGPARSSPASRCWSTTSPPASSAACGVAGMFDPRSRSSHGHRWLGDGVRRLVNHGLLPLASVLIEPAKVLFLNNAINHGVLGPLGVPEAAEHGKSILFMLEANPGPGLGLLLAYLFFGPGSPGLSTRRR